MAAGPWLLDPAGDLGKHNGALRPDRQAELGPAVIEYLPTAVHIPVDRRGLRARQLGVGDGPPAAVAHLNEKRYIDDMAVREFGIRELRNHTKRVLEAAEAGDRVFLTNRGRRVAELRSTTRSPVATLLAKAAELSGTETGWADELAAAKQADRAAQSDRWD